MTGFEGNSAKTPFSNAVLFLNLNPQNTNPQTKSSLPANFMRPYQGYGDIYQYEFASTSNYHALLASFQHRMSHGIYLAASYTFSKVLDCADAYSSAVDPFVDPRSRNYGPAGFDSASNCGNLSQSVSVRCLNTNNGRGTVTVPELELTDSSEDFLLGDDTCRPGLQICSCRFVCSGPQFRLAQSAQL